MPEIEDIELLAQYARENSEAAFTALVERHVNLVYSVALRSTGDAHAAQEIAQAVFIILTRKAKTLGAKTILSGWLYQTTRLTAANYLRGEIRRQKREQEAFMQSTLNEPDLATWRQIAPILDDAIAKLGAKDRDAIVLRFFENKNLGEVGAALGASEDAAKMRVNRALEKLRKIFAKRGVTFSAAIIAGTVSANSVQAAPAGLVKIISAVAFTKGAAAGASTLALVKGALKIMAWTKAKVAIITAVVILAAGTTAVTINTIQKHAVDPIQKNAVDSQQTGGNFQWQVEYPDSELLNQAPPLVEIVPTKFPNAGSYINAYGKTMGSGDLFIYIVEDAYGAMDTREVVSTPLPSGKFDFISSLPSGAMKALQQKLKTEFNVVAKREMIETNVLLLMVKDPSADGLKQSTIENGYQGNRPGNLDGKSQSLSTLADMLEERFRIPILDRTSLTNRYDFNLKWDEYGEKIGNQYPNYPNLEGLKQALLDQLGLELVPSRALVEMLVVEKVK
jgi:uncharacterized protein (TIGR03435 family)